MDVPIVIVGLVVLTTLAVVIGLMRASDGDARSRAWRRIAAARRDCGEERRRNRELWEALDLCRRCPLRESPPGRPDP